MGILDLSRCLFLALPLGNVLAAVLLFNEGSGRLVCLLGHAGGVGPQIGDKTDGAMALHVHALI